MKNTILFCLLTAATLQCNAQWIAPEGKIINNRTLVWNDFIGKPEKELLAEHVVATTQPAIYATTQGATVEELPNGKFKIKIKVKCAFQSAAWFKEDFGNMGSDYVLNHEADHYDIALTFANKLQQDFNNKEYDPVGYEKELDEIYESAYKKYEETQEKYDEMAGHGVQAENQHLWDLRIRKCMENNSDAWFNSPLSAIQNVADPGQTVKRLPDEPTRLFAVRCRPLYSEFNDELATKLIESKEWTGENSAVLAFYTQKFKFEKEYEATVEGKRLLAYAFMPQGDRNYKKTLIDTFSIDGKAPGLVSVFYANADSVEKTREMVVVTALDVKDKQRNGKQYLIRVYGVTGVKTFPNRLRRMTSVNEQLITGFDGIENGKPVKAHLKTEADIRAELKKLGYQ